MRSFFVRKNGRFSSSSFSTIEAFSMDIKHFLKDHAYQNIPLNYDEAYDLGKYALEGCAGDQLAQVQSIVALSALHTRATYEWEREWEPEGAWRQKAHGHRMPKNAAEQIAGVCAAVFDHDIARSPSGYLKPNVSYAMDNCGMGGDLIVTANVSTIAAFIAAAAGIPMAKHGSPANADSGRHGSSDFISLLGITTFASKEEVEACIESEKFGYTECLDTQYKTIHRQSHEIAKLPHMNDLIGPITNPLSHDVLTRRVLGLNHLVDPQLAAQAYQILNERSVTKLKHGLFVRGYAYRGHRNDVECVGGDNVGMDEVSICEGGTLFVELHPKKVTVRQWLPKDLGINEVSLAAISPPTGMSKGDFSLRILEGKVKGPPLQMVLANAALLFYLANDLQRLEPSDLRECYRLAEKVHESGDAYEKARAVAKRLPK